MTPAQQADLQKQFTRHFSQGIWRMIAFVAIYAGYCYTSLYLPEWLGIPLSSPGVNPPWYFIRRDFYTGLDAAAAILLTALLIGCTWRRYAVANGMLIFMTLLWLLPSVFTSAVIYLKCANFFDFDHAICGWPTFNAYLNSGTRYWGMIVAIAIGLPFLWMHIRLNQKAIRAISENSKMYPAS